LTDSWPVFALRPHAASPSAAVPASVAPVALSSARREGAVVVTHHQTGGFQILDLFHGSRIDP